VVKYTIELNETKCIVKHFVYNNKLNVVRFEVLTSVMRIQCYIAGSVVRDILKELSEH
jgi:hypothetical protein